MTDATEHPVEFLPELALAVLPPAEAAPIRAHLASCAACAAEYHELSRVASLLPLAATEIAPSRSVKARLMRRIAAESETIPMPFRRHGAALLVSGAASVVALAIVAAVIGYVAGNDSPTASSSPVAAEEYGIFARAVARGAVERASVREGETWVSLVRAPGRSVAYVWVEGLPALSEGDHYQAWVSAEDSSLVALQQFDTNNGGVWVSAPASFDSYSLFALSVESGEPAQPVAGLIISLNLASDAALAPPYEP